MRKALKEYGEDMREEFVPQLNERGKTTLYDVRTGEAFKSPITVGVANPSEQGQAITITAQLFNKLVVKSFVTIEVITKGAKADIKSPCSKTCR